MRGTFPQQLCADLVHTYLKEVHHRDTAGEEIYHLHVFFTLICVFILCICAVLVSGPFRMIRMIICKDQIQISLLCFVTSLPTTNATAVQLYGNLSELRTQSIRISGSGMVLNILQIVPLN